jgi:hypothetical protein
VTNSGGTHGEGGQEYCIRTLRHPPTHTFTTTPHRFLSIPHTRSPPLACSTPHTIMPYNPTLSTPTFRPSLSLAYPAPLLPGRTPRPMPHSSLHIFTSPLPLPSPPFARQSAAASTPSPRTTSVAASDARARPSSGRDTPASGPCISSRYNSSRYNSSWYTSNRHSSRSQYSSSRCTSNRCSRSRCTSRSSYSRLQISNYRGCFRSRYSRRHTRHSSPCSSNHYRNRHSPRGARMIYLWRRWRWMPGRWQ